MERKPIPIEKTEELEEFLEEHSFEFSDLVAEQLNNPRAMGRFVSEVLDSARKGDAMSLKIITQALADVKFRNDKKEIVTNEQLKRIINLTAERLRAE